MAHTARSSKIDSDPQLSDEGRRAHRPRAVQEAARDLLAIQKIRDELEKSVERMMPMITTTTHRHRLPTDARRDEALQAEGEVRAFVRAMEPPERDAFFLQACRNGDQQAVRAMELAPNAFPLVSPEALAEGAELFATTAYPDEYRRLSERRSALGSINADLGRAIRTVTGDAGGVI